MVSEKLVMTVIRASRPSYKNNYDKVAFAVHASFLASGYILTATGRAASSDIAISDPSTDEVGIDSWNELDGEYAFVYANPDKDSKKVVVKCLVMNGKLLVDALAEDGTDPVHLQINNDDYVKENEGTFYNEHYKNLDKLVKSLDAEILSKLYGPPTAELSSSKTRESSENNREEPFPEPYGIAYPPVTPFGGSDIYPGPGAGVFPSRDIGVGGGMLLGPNDPRWLSWRGGDPAFPGRPEGVPPGARFDPYNPPGIPGFEPNRINRFPGRRGGGGIHPDLEHFGSGSGGDFI